MTTNIKTSAKAKQDPRVFDIFMENDYCFGKPTSWWIYLREGYICESMGCATIHEATLKEALWLLNNDVIKVND